MEPSLCLFAAYFQDGNLPAYIRHNLLCLKRQYSKVALLLPNAIVLKVDALRFLEANHILCQPQENRGWDFGLWFRSLQSIDLSAFGSLVLMNDSGLVVHGLTDFQQWFQAHSAVVAGLTDSEEIGWHLQSYFLAIKKAAFPALEIFMQRNALFSDDYSETVHRFEIGLSAFLKNQGLELAAYIPYNSLNHGPQEKGNPSLLHADQLIQRACPILKRRLLLGNLKASELRYLIKHKAYQSPSKYIDLMAAEQLQFVKDIKALSIKARFSLPYLKHYLKV
ncbi:MAG: rhamnan synthesis F family protein, partial [Bacteroidota bacterium]